LGQQLKTINQPESYGYGKTFTFYIF
jgi:hypothetical protein